MSAPVLLNLLILKQLGKRSNSRLAKGVVTFSQQV